MTPETALRINAAACQVYFYRHGFVSELAIADALLIKEVTAAQIETAIEIVQAVNRDGPRDKEGYRLIRGTLADDEIPRVKEFVATLI